MKSNIVIIENTVGLSFSENRETIVPVKISVLDHTHVFLKGVRRDALKNTHSVKRQK